MLYGQMMTRSAIAVRLFSRAANNMNEYLQATEIHMRLGLKAQAQCARTAEVLGNLRAGPSVFAKQANMANQQQVNNGIPALGRN